MQTEYKNKKPILANNSGAILLVTLFMTVILAIFATASLRNSTMELRFTDENVDRKDLFNMAEGGAEISVRIAKIMFEDCYDVFDENTTTKNYKEKCITDELGDFFTNELAGDCAPMDTDGFCLDNFNDSDFNQDINNDNPADTRDILMRMQNNSLEIDIDPNPGICDSSGDTEEYSCKGITIVSTITPQFCRNGDNSNCAKTVTVRYKCLLSTKYSRCLQ